MASGLFMDRFGASPHRRFGSGSKIRLPRSFIRKAATFGLDPAERTLLRRLYNYYIDPSCYRQQSVLNPTHRSSSTLTPQRGEEQNHRLDERAWHDAYRNVQHLYLQQLITASTTICRADSILNHHESQQQPQSPYLSIPYKPIWVDTIQQLLMVRNAIAGVELVAIDAEWHDSDDPSHTTKDTMLSTLQIAMVHQKTSTQNEPKVHYDTAVWVIDVIVPNDEYRNQCQSLIRDMLSTKIVLGFAVSNDMKRLEHFCNSHGTEVAKPLVSLLSSTKCLLDVQSLWKHGSIQIPGLARCVEDVSSAITATSTTTTNPPIKLSKEYQCSDWSQRPLSPLQLQYAGLDAVVVLYLLAEQYRRRTSTGTSNIHLDRQPDHDHGTPDPVTGSQTDEEPGSVPV